MKTACGWRNLQVGATSCAYRVGASLRAKSAGAQIVHEIKDKDEDYGGRGFTCRDPQGHISSVGTYDPWQALVASAIDHGTIQRMKCAWARASAPSRNTKNRLCQKVSRTISPS